MSSLPEARSSPIPGSTDSARPSRSLTEWVNSSSSPASKRKAFRAFSAAYWYRYSAR